ncbi:ectonucleoside triphosphate diphosphohydrolase 1 isoform X2 [Folsomia candida]|uniref:ectonucleoside triphosphate diphosphohydrolase 1 isoform X2 n=1 Tax=Folsomia candida TaxID=158441 RepID=UPI00160526CF|nr:ectonucleoside triphosphate diphosphohydrolase 1 isoform X2 [Folsomia candida]
MLVHVTVESSFTGPGGGFQQISIDDRASVHELIRQYCTAKGIAVNPNYSITNRSNMLLQGNKTLSYYAVKENESLLLGTTADHNRTYRFGHWFTLAGLGFLFGLLGITICVILFAVIRTVPDNYAIVVDAGSTHSDVILYKWPGAKVNNTGEVVQVSTCYVTGGLAQVTTSNVSSYFKECFGRAEGQIPPESQATAEVLLGATAGMRMLNSSDPSQANKAIASVRDYLRTTDMVVKESNVGIISGSIEGISGWITINFLKDTIYSAVGHLNSSWGALDLGGASTQITFEVSESMHSHPLVTKLKLFGHQFHVFSQSFQCYGVVQAGLRYKALLLQEHWNDVSGPNQQPLNSPCDPFGRKILLTGDDFQTPCLKSINLASKIMESHRNYSFLGTGNYSECESYAKRLLDLTQCRATGWDKCINGSSIPDYVGDRKFMGFASFAYVANALQINKTTTKSSFLERAKRLCSLSYDKVLEMKLTDKTNFKDLENSCFKSLFVYNMLSNIYGFNTDEKWTNVKFTTKISHATLGWSLGYMINATDKIAAGAGVPTLRTVPFALLLVLFAMFLIISIGFVMHGIKLRKSSSYQRK